MKRDFKNPIWHNEEKKVIACEIAIIDDEGTESLHNAKVNKFSTGDKINPDWTFLLDKFTLEEIDKLTEDFDKEQQEIIEKRKNIQEEESTRVKERKVQEELFAKKLEIFELPEVKESKNRTAKSKIRKAKSEIEAVVHAARLIIQDEAESNSEE